jgi:hypothetical protein
VSFQPKERIINVFIHGLIRDEIDGLLDRLKQCSKFFPFPSLLPMILLELRLDISTRNSRWTFQKIQEIERATGLDPGWEFTLRDLPSSGVDITQINYPRLTHHITAISARVAHYAFVCKVHGDMPNKLDAINSELVASASTVEDSKELSESEALLRVRTAHLREYLKATLARAEHLESRLQCQRDTVSNYEKLPKPEKRVLMKVAIQLRCAAR